MSGTVNGVWGGTMECRLPTAAELDALTKEQEVAAMAQYNSCVNQREARRDGMIMGAAVAGVLGIITGIAIGYAARGPGRGI